MAITISGQNNNDKILASDGVLDSISGFNVVGVLTATTFETTAFNANHINVGSTIQLGNAGIITATTLIGNVTGNVNSTSNLLFQISGSEKFRVGNGGQLGIGGANYGSSGQVLTSGGSGSAPTWSTINSDKITEGNTEAEVVDTGSDGHFKVTTEGSERLRIDSSGNVLVGTTDSSVYNNSSGNGIVLRGGQVIDVARSNDLQLSLNRMGNDGPHIAFYKGGGVKSYISTRNNAFCIDVNSTNERLRIQSDGRLVISTNANTTTSFDYAAIHFNSDNSTVAEGLFINNVAANTGDNASISFSTDSGNRKKSAISHVDTGNYGRGDLVFSIDPDADSGELDIVAHEKLRIDSSGHMGLGVTPNANWPTNSDFKALQIGTGACVFGRGSGDEDRGGIAVNWYSTGSANKYIGNGNAARIYLADGNIYFSTAGANSSGANASMTLSDRMILSSSGRLGLGGFQHNYTMNSQSTDLVIGDGGGGRGITFWTAGAADNQTISFQTNETLSRAEGEISYGPTATSTVADRNAMMFRTNSAERFRIDKNGSLTNTTNSTHSQGAGTFNIKGVINQYSQGSGSGLIFDCDFGRLTGYGDDTNVTNGTNLSACLAHSTTDWTSSSSNTPMTVNGGTLQYRVGFGGYMEGISDGGRVSVGAGSGVPAMSDKLNTANMTIETWCWYDGTDREVIVSRYGSGFPNNFNMIADPDGQFHYNSSGAGAGGGNVSGEHFPDKTWHHHLWQYESGVHRWYINGAFANSRSSGSSVAVSSGTGFGIFSRADDYERWRGKIAIVRIYNRALSATEIKNHFELERGRFGV